MRPHEDMPQPWRSNRHADAALERRQHARDLAHLAGRLADRHGGSVQGQGLIVARLAGEGGLIVWLAEEGRPVLHVLPTGVILYHEAGDWEQRLVDLGQEVMPCT